MKSEEIIKEERKFVANNYHPIPVVLNRGKGVYVWDIEGKRYLDFLSAYSAVNQGHCHPRIIKKLQEQSEVLTLTTRAFHSKSLGKFSEYITKYFSFDKVLPMNTGAEAVETAIKLARKWGYEKKNIPNNEAKIIVAENNFHGRTTTIISFSDNPNARENFGPFTKGFIKIPYNDLDALKKALSEQNVIGFLVEPIQGEAGVIIPDSEYLSKSKKLCQEKNVLFITDEIQTGICRTGSLLAVCGNCSCENNCEQQETYVRPDILILGKSLSGGVFPVSAVLADDEIMSVINPGQHGSTYGGNPLASQVSIEALKVVIDEKLMLNARKMGELFRNQLNKIISKTKIIKLIRGKGLLNAVVINDSPNSNTARDICLDLAKNNLLAKPTHGNIIRFSPPLVITEEQLLEGCKIIESVFTKYNEK